MAPVRRQVCWRVTLQAFDEHGDELSKPLTVDWSDGFLRDRHPGHAGEVLQNMGWDLCRPLEKAGTIGKKRRKNYA